MSPTSSSSLSSSSLSSSRGTGALVRDEWPTWAVIVAVHGAWLAAIWQADALGPWVGTGILIVVTCWFMSVQHELIHGHPTRSPAVNRLLGIAPLAVWYPYDLYRESHLAHHRDERLTEPGLDPESNYLSAARFERMPAAGRLLWFAQRTVIGRVLLGPAMVIVPVWFDILRRPWQGDFSQCRLWLVHLALLAAMLAMLEIFAGIGPLRYAMTIAYPAMGLAMMRSFYEHRPADDAAHRVVINEAGWFWRWLYLNNNYHAVHHEHPGLPWHRLRRHYLAHRAAVLRRNGGFLIPGYGALLRRHALTPVDSPVHPAAPQR